MKCGETAFRSSLDALLALVWHDKKEVKMLSSMYTAEMINTHEQHKDGSDILRPHYVLSYYRRMGKVDKSDQQANSYHCVRKSVKWYKNCSMFWTSVL